MKRAAWGGLIVIGLLTVLSGWYLRSPQFARQRATPPVLITHQSTTTMETSLTLTSSVFTNDGLMPAAYSCDGAGELPPLQWQGAPAGTVAFAIVMDDPDIPEVFKQQRNITKFDHFGMYDIPATVTNLDATSDYPLAQNGRGERSYVPPCPPPEYQPAEHRYIFRLYALGQPLSFATTPTLDELEAAAKKVALASSTLIGRYTRAH